ncbi:DUF58 domain-containing protein [Modestobacter sp. NPDC049651]|uniref:DUF58 domain-containing protein n=1 Tax=unclassified Modestobacter TaxID=2643866 RepID=UPI0033CC165A
MARGRLADAASTLTVRGRCLVAGGLTLLVLGALLGERSLVQLALFVLALPVLSAVGVARQRFRLASRRTVTPPRLARGADAEVLLEVSNTDRRAGGLWVLSEQLAPELQARPRFVVDRLGSGATAALRYGLHGGRRGRFTLGPLRLRLVDPFGLVRRTVAGTDTASLLVVPRVRTLQGGPSLAGAGGDGGEGARRSIAVHGEDDVSTREYRHGDDLRLVHWRATARTGELMVRQEERPSRASATVLLDTRATAHLLGGRGAATPADPGAPPDTLEWLVEAAATIGAHLLERGAAVRVVTDTGELLPATRRGGLTTGDLLEQLAVLTPSRSAGLQVGLEALRRAGNGPLVCLLGAVEPEDVAALAGSRSGPGQDIAVLIDPASWLDAGATRGRRPMNASARTYLLERQDAATRTLRAAGWQVVAARADRTVEQVWAQLAAPAAAPVPWATGVPA